jgi:copper chaperone CopZ
MKHLFVIALSSFVLFSCGGGEEKTDETEKNKEKAAQVEGTSEEVKKEIVANAETTINIDGMVCEHACVSSVKKNILAMEGVSDIIIDFDKERKVNSCTVKFDDGLVSEEDFVNKINEINDGAYKVVDGEEPILKEQKTKKKNDEENNDVSQFLDLDGSINASGSSIGDSFFTFPSLFDLFTFGF